MVKLWYEEVIKAIRQEKDIQWFIDYFNNHNPIVKKNSNLLSVAIKCRRSDLVKLFIDKGIDVNEEFREARVNYTPLHKAVYHQNSDIVKILIQSGAYTDIKGKWKHFDGTPNDWNHIKKGKAFRSISNILNSSEFIEKEEEEIHPSAPEIQDNDEIISNRYDTYINNSNQLMNIQKLNEKYLLNLNINHEIDSLIVKIDSNIEKCDDFLKLVNDINHVNEKLLNKIKKDSFVL